MNRLNSKLREAEKVYNILDEWLTGQVDMGGVAEEAWIEGRDEFMFWQCLACAVRKY